MPQLFAVHMPQRIFGAAKDLFTLRAHDIRIPPAIRILLSASASPSANRPELITERPWGDCL
jgi:hypothetical protein